MWHIALRHNGYRSRYESSRGTVAFGPTRSLGTEGYAGSLFICEGKEQMGRAQYVVCGGLH